jgi:Saxitoxin biosynthesis operon protein SxtJ
MRDEYFGSHEFQRRDDDAKAASNRSFGLVFAAFFALLAVLGLWHGTSRWPIWLALAGVALVLALAAPRTLTPFNWVWTKFGLLLHRIVSPIFLAVMFYGCIAPIGFLMRWSGKDPLRRRYEPAAESYWIVRTPPGPTSESFKNQF